MPEMLVMIDFSAESSYLDNPCTNPSIIPETRVTPMFAVVEIAGKQFKVAPNQSLLVPTLPQKSGDAVRFDHVLLVEGEKGISVGHPTVTGAAVEARVLDHVKGDKVIVFKKKKRKGYRVTRGHRQAYTKVQITNIAL
jgi:large subunit ribosomal protein L21